MPGAYGSHGSPVDFWVSGGPLCDFWECRVEGWLLEARGSSSWQNYGCVALWPQRVTEDEPS